MEDRIIAHLAMLGWKKDRLVDAFSKTFETAVVPNQASIWLKFDRECGRWWLTNSDFTSAGENVLAASSVFFPADVQRDIEPTIDAFVAEMERKIAGAFSVRLLRK